MVLFFCGVEHCVHTAEEAEGCYFWDLVKTAVTQAKLLMYCHSSYTAKNNFSFIVHWIHLKKDAL